MKKTVLLQKNKISYDTINDRIRKGNRIFRKQEN